MTRSNKTLRICAIYCRVSKDEQNPKNQENLLKTWTKNNNVRIHKVYTDITSGRKDTRPQLNQLLIDMRQGFFNCIVAFKLDRVGRSLKHLITICEELNNKNVDLIITSQNIDTKTASGKLLFHILGAVAEFEAELISERTKAGLRNAKNVGKRGKDKKPRRRAGYNLRYQKKGGLSNA